MRSIVILFMSVSGLLLSACSPFPSSPETAFSLEKNSCYYCYSVERTNEGWIYSHTSRPFERLLRVVDSSGASSQVWVGLGDTLVVLPGQYVYMRTDSGWAFMTDLDRR